MSEDQQGQAWWLPERQLASPASLPLQRLLCLCFGGAWSRMGGCRLHGAAEVTPTVAQIRAETGTATAVRIRDVTLIWHGPAQTPALSGSVPAI